MFNIQFSRSRFSFIQIIAVLLIAFTISSCSEESEDNQQAIWDFKKTLPLTDSSSSIETSQSNESLSLSDDDDTEQNIVIPIVRPDSLPDVNNPAVITGVRSGSVTEDVDPDVDTLYFSKEDENIGLSVTALHAVVSVLEGAISMQNVQDKGFILTSYIPPV